jgi:hypothetical protein
MIFLLEEVVSHMEKRWHTGGTYNSWESGLQWEGAPNGPFREEFVSHIVCATSNKVYCSHDGSCIEWAIQEGVCVAHSAKMKRCSHEGCHQEIFPKTVDFVSCMEVIVITVILWSGSRCSLPLSFTHHNKEEQRCQGDSNWKVRCVISATGGHLGPLEEAAPSHGMTAYIRWCPFFG